MGWYFAFLSSRPHWPKCFKRWLLLIDALTWLWTVFSWLLKVMVKLVDVLGATWVMNGVLLWFTVSYIFTRRLQISMFWKQDLTLCKEETENQLTNQHKLTGPHSALH